MRAAPVAALAAALLWGCGPAQGSDAGMDPAATEVSQDAGPVLAFVGAHVIPMDGEEVLANHTVVVRGQRIEAVGPASAVEIPAGAERIEARGRYLIPGLVDMHVHFDRPEHEGDLALYLANGVTSIRNMNAATVPGITGWREEVARGERIAPTIYTTGPTLRTLSDSAQVERVLAEHRRGGYDFIKVYVGLPADLYGLLMRRAREEGIPVVGHVPVAAGLAATLRAGQQTLEHVEDLFQSYFEMRTDTTRIPELVSLLSGSRACVVPTLVVFSNVVHHFEQYPHLSGLMARPELRYVGPATRREWEPERNSYVRRSRRIHAEMPAVAIRIRQQFEFMKRIVAALDTAGVPLLAGSDANIPHTVPGFSLLEELEIMVEQVGLTPRAALRSATRTPAECMGRTEEFGSVVPGRRADLVLLEANPLDDIRNLRRRVGVLARGHWLPEAELQHRMMNRVAR